jgi:hypothetical protein
MDIKALDKALLEIVKKREELSKIDYNNPTYDDLEEKLHDLEDAFQDSHGEYLEEALEQIHDEHCPESDVLMPIAYLGKGVFVDAEKFPGKEVRLVLVPSPTRFLFQVGDKEQVVWTAK